MLGADLRPGADLRSVAVDRGALARPVCDRRWRWVTSSARRRSRCLARSGSPGGASAWKSSMRRRRAGRAAAAGGRERASVPRGSAGMISRRSRAGGCGSFDPFPWGIETTEAIWLRGNLLFRPWRRGCSEHPGEQIQAAGGLVGAGRCRAPLAAMRASRKMLLSQARGFRKRTCGAPGSYQSLRPLSMLAALAMRDCSEANPSRSKASPRRVAAMLRHRFAGRSSPAIVEIWTCDMDAALVRIPYQAELPDRSIAIKPASKFRARPVGIGLLAVGRFQRPSIGGIRPKLTFIG